MRNVLQNSVAHNAMKQARFRKERPGPEADLVFGAVQSGLPFKWQPEGVLLREPEIASGAPDLVLLRLHPESERYRELEEIELKLLHFISTYKVSRVDEIVALLCWSEKTTNRTLSHLEDLGLIESRKEKILITPAAKALLAREIVAVEAKIGAWRDAVMQASRNQWFSSQSYILLHAVSVKSKVIDACANVGVGLLAFDGSRTKTIVRSARSRLPGSYASWMLSQWGHERKTAA